MYMKPRLPLTVLLLLSGLVVFPVGGATYYVAPTGNDGNPGSEASPWETLGHGVAQLSAGDTLVARAGTYPEALPNTIPAGTDWSSAVTVQAFDGEAVVLKPAAGPANVVTVSGAATGYIVLRGLELDGANVSGAAVSIAGDAHHVRIEHCRVRNAPGHGIEIGGNGSRNIVVGNVVDGNGGDGIVVEGHHTEIWNNTVYQNTGTGILLTANAYRVQIINNLCWANGSDAIAGAGDAPRIFHNLTGTDPSFADAGAGDFTPGAGSAAIDAGMPYDDADTDYAGQDRPQGWKWDIGAVEAPQTQGITTGTFFTERPTLHCLGFRWSMQGDENRNATCTLEYRESGQATWRQGIDLLRIHGDEVAGGDYTTSNLFAGSILELDPDTSYDYRLTVSDPDGGPGDGVQQQGTLSTRKEVEAATGGTERHVYPAGWTGSRINPDYNGVQAAYDAAAAGDVILVHAGNHPQDLTLTKVATASQPITIRGAGDGEAKLRGVGNTLVNATGSAYLLLEDLTLYDAQELIRAEPATGLTVRRCSLHTTPLYGIRALSFACRDFTIMDNLIIGPDTVWSPRGSSGTHAIWLQGQGHVVAHNTIAYWWDGVDLAGGVPSADPALQNAAVDFYGNDVSGCMDDTIELDYGVHNLRCWNNRLWNTFVGISTQPVYGGPAYIYRNLVYNCTGTAIKLNQFPSGLLVANNTFIAYGGSAEWQRLWTNTRILNNLAVGIDGSWNWLFSSGTATPGFSVHDYNGYRVHTIGAEHGSRPWFWRRQWPGPTPAGSSWSLELTATGLAELRSYVGIEEHGIDTVTPQTFESYIAPTGGTGDPPLPPDLDLRLRTGSVAIDAGTPINQITDGHAGAAPDLGAYEFGTEPPHYGRRAGRGAAGSLFRFR